MLCGWLFLYGFCFFLFARELNLREKDRAEHEDAAEDLARGRESPENDRLGNGGEEGLKAHDKRADCGLGVFLTDRLKRVCHAAGKHTRKENGEECCHDLVGVEALKNKHRNGRKGTRNEELNAGELKAIHARCEAVDREDLKGECDRAHQREKVTNGDTPVRTRDAKQIQTCHGECDAEPEVRADLSSHKEADDGHENDIHGGNEARLACRGTVGNADLLKAGGNAKAEAADNTPEDELFLAFDAHGLVASLALLFEIQNKNNGEENDRTDHRAHGLIFKRTDELHRHVLRDEGTAPDKCGHKKENVSFDL